MPFDSGRVQNDTIQIGQATGCLGLSRLLEVALIGLCRKKGLSGCLKSLVEACNRLFVGCDREKSESCLESASPCQGLALIG